VESSEIQAQPEIKFVYSEHSLSNFKNIWEEVKYSNIILLEGVGGSDDSRRFNEFFINYAALSADPQFKKNALHLLENPGNNIDFHSKLVEAVVQNEKEFHYIDESDRGEGKRFSDIAKTEIEAAIEIHLSGKPLDAYEHYKKYVSNMTKAIKLRNETVKKQITELIKSNSTSWFGKKIAVIQGEGHRETYPDLKRTIVDAKLTRTFLQPKISFAILSEIENRINHGKDQNIEDLIKRGFLGVFVIPRKSEEIPNGVDIKTADKILRLIPNEELNVYFEKIKKLQEYLSDKNNKKFNEEYLTRQLEIMGTEIIEKYSKQ